MGNKNVILDTNILIAICREKKKVSDFLVSIGAKNGFITEPTYIEFLGGAKLHQKRWAKKFLEEFVIIQFSTKTQVVSTTLSLQNQLSKEKCTDLLIASVCIANKMPLVTANIDDFIFKKLDVIKYLP